MRLAYEQQFLKWEQIRDQFFGGNRRATSRRILLLRQAGLVRLEKPTSTMVQGEVIRLTTMGKQAVQESHPLRIPQKRKVGLTTLDHDALVTDLRLRLAEFWDAVWLPERSLKREEYREVPDGVLLFPSKRKIAVELENSAKGQRRYQQLFARWRGKDMFLVLYVTTRPNLQILLKRVLSQAPQDVVFGLFHWPELKNGAPKLWTPKGEIDLLAQRTF